MELVSKVRVPLAALLVATAVAAPAAQAADPSDVTVAAGSGLTITNPLVGDFASATLDGNAISRYTTFEDFDASDTRGTGGGWNITVQATQFAEFTSGSYVTDGKTLPLNSLQLAAVTAAKKDATSSAVPSIASASPWSIDAGSAVTIASAAAGDGMGSYTFTQGDLDAGTTGAQPLKLTIPASAYAKDYRSDVTVSIVTGP